MNDRIGLCRVSGRFTRVSQKGGKKDTTEKEIREGRRLVIKKSFSYRNSLRENEIKKKNGLIEEFDVIRVDISLYIYMKKVNKYININI